MLLPFAVLTTGKIKFKTCLWDLKYSTKAGKWLQSKSNISAAHKSQQLGLLDLQKLRLAKISPRMGKELTDSHPYLIVTQGSRVWNRLPVLQ